jgi:hypothetical protein
MSWSDGSWPCPCFPKLVALCHTVALPLTLKSILRQKKNYEFHHAKKYNLQKNPPKETKNHFQDIIYNSIITNLKF